MRAGVRSSTEAPLVVSAVPSHQSLERQLHQEREQAAAQVAALREDRVEQMACDPDSDTMPLYLCDTWFCIRCVVHTLLGVASRVSV